jgi:hypothetical protein
MAKFFEEEKCPICNSMFVSTELFGKRIVIFECKHCGKFGITHDLLNMNDDQSEFLFKCINLMHSFLISHHPSATGLPFVFFYVEGYEDLSKEIHPELYINLYELLNRFPKKPYDKLTFVLNNIHCLFSETGFHIEYYSEEKLGGWARAMSQGQDESFFDARTFCCMTNDKWEIVDEIHQTILDFEEYQYIKIIHPEHNPNNDLLTMPEYFTLSLKGRELIDGMKKQTLKQGFIAISFSGEAQQIIAAIKKGISDAGFVPRVISDKEYNGQVVPEIFYEICQSSFVIMDSTYPNYGAYYEAGYAKGVKIPVIFTCRKDVFDSEVNPINKPHFDILQEKHIIWTDEADLTSKLKKRIEATMYFL